MRLTKTKLKQIIKEELSKVLKEAEEAGRSMSDMSDDDLINTMKSTEYQKVYLFAKAELKKRGYDDQDLPDAHEEDAPGSFPTGLEGLPGYTQLRGN